MKFDEFDKIIEDLEEFKSSNNQSEIYFIKKNLIKLEKKISRQINPKNRNDIIIILSTLKEISNEYFNKKFYDLNELDYYMGIILNLKEELDLINY